MFEVKILNDQDQAVQGIMDTKASPAAYFSGCVHLLVDLLNGGSNLNQMFKATNRPGIIDTKLAPSMAIPFFIGELHKHPSFAPEIVFKEDYVNYPFFQELAGLLQIEATDTSTHIYLLKLLEKFKIPGIKLITFTNDLTRNQEILYQCNFPDELIPEEYLCALTNQIMDTPCCDTRSPGTIFDQNKIQKVITEKGKNPYTNIALATTDLKIETELKVKIDNFIKKIILIITYCPKTYNEEYKKLKDKICGNTAAADFETELKEKFKNKTTVENLIAKKQVKNPLLLYQQALQKYKENDFEGALHLLTEALTGFTEKSGNDSEECYKCYSTIISCYRDLKKYDSAISFADKAIIIFSGKHDLSSIIKKYHECLKLRGDTLNEIYDKAIDDYKDGRFNSAICKLSFCIDTFKSGDLKSKIAFCHSTIASCYREIKQYDLAVEHCEKALSLRKSFLKEGDKLINDTEQKLKKLQSNLSTSENDYK